MTSSAVESARSTSLNAPEVSATLDRLHRAARGDWKRILRITPQLLAGLVTGKSLMQSITPADMKDAYLPISREGGRFLYAAARAMGARRIVEFGTSFAISTIYLAAATRDSGGGKVFATEIEPSKCKTALANLQDAGLADQVTLLEGDAMKTLAEVEGPIDLVFLDGWKDLYIPVLEMLKPRLRPGALVLADNVDMRDCKPYLAHVRAPHSGFVCTTLFGTMEMASYA